ncbi:hypothetical protein F5Y18DRAFT_425552 [Xylariaceae sp. FL1019]|nr:hypothetical protein F5Y18DRAFT_425552 [Xylariaceae sp. FL1019]
MQFTTLLCILAAGAGTSVTAMEPSVTILTAHAPSTSGNRTSTTVRNATHICTLSEIQNNTLTSRNAVLEQHCYPVPVPAPGTASSIFISTGVSALIAAAMAWTL